MSTNTAERIIGVVLGEMLFEFASFNDWRNNASTKYGKHFLAGQSPYMTLAVDAFGRPCLRGIHFQRARLDGGFPIRVYKILDGPGNAAKGKSL